MFGQVTALVTMGGHFLLPIVHNIKGVLPRGVTRIASQSAVLRLLFKSPWTTRYSEVHRTSSFTVVPFRVRLPNYVTSPITKGYLWYPFIIGIAKGSRTPDSSVRG